MWALIILKLNPTEMFIYLLKVFSYTIILAKKLPWKMKQSSATSRGHLTNYTFLLPTASLTRSFFISLNLFSQSMWQTSTSINTCTFNTKQLECMHIYKQRRCSLLTLDFISNLPSNWKSTFGNDTLKQLYIACTRPSYYTWGPFY